MSDTENEEYFDDGVEAEPLSEGDSDPFSQLEAFIFAKCSQRKNFVKVDAEDEYQEPGPSPTTTPSKKDPPLKVKSPTLVSFGRPTAAGAANMLSVSRLTSAASTKGGTLITPPNRNVKPKQQPVLVDSSQQEEVDQGASSTTLIPITTRTASSSPAASPPAAAKNLRGHHQATKAAAAEEKKKRLAAAQSLKRAANEEETALPPRSLRQRKF
jgi:hypothetical protein